MATGFEKYPKLYGSARWRRLRALVLNEEPLCRLCERQGKTTAADTVDHIKEHKGDVALFYDRDNLQPLCASCHSGIKRIADRHGYSQAADANGFPIDSGHPWNKGRGGQNV